MIEIWKDIQGYEGYYQVSNLGRVKSVSRFRASGGGGYVQKERIIKTSFALGYERCSLWLENKPKDVKIHVLVASAFINNECKKPQVNHIDGDKTNNNLSNLEWVTAKENMIHSYASLKRKHCNKKKISDKDVIEIRRWKATTNITYSELAKIYGVDPANVCNIVNHKARVNAYGVVR